MRFLTLGTLLLLPFLLSPCGCWAASAGKGMAHFRGTEDAAVYTTNAVCLRKNCVNPIFPGLEDLHRLSKTRWSCATLEQTHKSMGFCRAAVNYDPVLPTPNGQSSLEALVKAQDKAATTMFVYHMAGLGLEAWEQPKPELSDDDCVKAIWRMVCYTYFPRAQVGCQEGMESEHLRPCQSSCQNYIRACGVECCDESVQCVFEHKKVITPTVSLTTSGYVPHDGPSSLCTGAAWGPRASLGGQRLLHVLLLLQILWAWAPATRSHSTSAKGLARAEGGVPRSSPARPGRGYGFRLLAPALASFALLLQGCDYDVPSHKVGNWRAENDYLIDFEFIPPGSSAKEALLNSCALTRLSQTVQCSGRGICKMWDPGDLGNSVAFCECDRDWADPECKTRRKSQSVAFLLSLLFGFFGADHFYLGFMTSGILKFATLGGFGVWWIIDVIRIGSAPVLARRYRLAADMPHWAFVLTIVGLGLTIGFTLAGISAAKLHMRRRKDALLLQAEEEAVARGAVALKSSGPKGRLGQAAAAAANVAANAAAPWLRSNRGPAAANAPKAYGDGNYGATSQCNGAGARTMSPIFTASSMGQ
mmetsp:Transcript_134106/g.286761  ORF Transcript_134106/g.286761 Transcript_134106/m.286761 type:complete len:588 (-) Transcript_134106:165-1928(-)